MIKYLGVLLIAVAFLFFFNIGVEKQEKAECFQWQKDAKQYDGFYYTDWQQKQCEHYGIF